jgi:hypothetical protein
MAISAGSTIEGHTPLMVRQGLIYFEDSIYPLSNFRAAHMQRGLDGTFISLIDLGVDDQLIIYEGTKEKDARDAIEYFVKHVARKPQKKISVIH